MYKQLNQEQRYQIAAFLKAGYSLRKIAEQIKVSVSTVSRELKRNGSARSYNGSLAHMYATDRQKDKPRKKKFTLAMSKLVDAKLRLKWSPEQIKGRCKKEGVDMISHECIYQYVWQNKRQGGSLWKELRHGHRKYRKRYGSKDNRGLIPNRTTIDKRPDIVEQKTRIGDWEIDTIVGKDHQSSIVTATERKTQFTLLSKLPNLKSSEARKTVINMFAPYKKEVLTITSDNGREFYEHQAIAQKLQAQYYFAHPYHSWERGLNEYHNKLIRQYLPKKTDFKPIEHIALIEIQNHLNGRPRKKLNYQTPNEVFLNYSVALTG